MKLHDI